MRGGRVYHGDDGVFGGATDPSHHGQILVQTFPLIGNYGVIPEDPLKAGRRSVPISVRECCQAPSNFRCEGTLASYLKAQNVIGLCGGYVELTRAIREMA